MFLSISAMNAISSVCRYCGKAFGSQSTLRLHEMWHRGEGPYTCTECDVMCFSKGVHTRHIVSHFKIRTFKCKICSNCLASQSELERHEREAKYKCTTCERKFEEKEQLADHVGRDTGEKKKHSCQMCNKAFPFRSNMNRKWSQPPVAYTLISSLATNRANILLYMCVRGLCL